MAVKSGLAVKSVLPMTSKTRSAPELPGAPASQSRPEDERDEHTEWVIDTVNWLHRPKSVLVYGPGPVLLRERWISHDNQPWGSLGSGGLRTREESRLTGDLGAPGNPAITRVHDVFGNPVLLTDPRNCTTETVFETTHRTYPDTVTTCLGDATQFTHAPRGGRRLSEQDPNGQTTTYTCTTPSAASRPRAVRSTRPPRMERS